MIGIPSQKILKHFPLRKGEPALIIAGRNMGVAGRIKDVKDRKSMLEKGTVTIETEKGKGIETLKDYVMVGSLSEIPAGASEKESEKEGVTEERKRQERKPAKKKHKAEEGQA
jgi:hypothetical protein